MNNTAAATADGVINVRYALSPKAHKNLVRYQRKLRMTIDPEITREQAINHLLAKLKV